MKKIAAVSAILFLFFTGCATVTETIYLQDIKVYGPINHPPIHITNGQKNNSVTISPHIALNTSNSFSGRVNGHTLVDQNGIYRVDKFDNGDKTWTFKETDANKYEFKGTNLQWNIPYGSLGVDMDWALSDHVALFGSINYVVQNQNDLFGSLAGLGYFNQGSNSGTRFDFGISWQNMYYDASTVVVTQVHPVSDPDYSYVTFYRDKDKSSSMNFFASFTYNTAFTDFPVNFFLNAGYFSQSLFDFEPQRADAGIYTFAFDKKVIDARGKATAAFFNISPGIYQEISNLGRVVLGVKLINETQLETKNNSFFVVPVFQFDFRL